MIKQRIGRAGQGRSGGFGSLIAFRIGDRAVFLYGFAKNERENIDRDELIELRKLAITYLKADEVTVAAMIADGTVVEVGDGEGK